MTRDTQLAWTKKQLLTKHRVSRNEALRRYYSRLASRIAELKEAGWKIEGHRVKTKHGEDYVYELQA